MAEKKVVDIVDKSAEAAAQAEAEAKKAAEAAAASGDKVGDLFKGDKKEEGKTVPEAAFLELKNENKAVWSEVKKLQDMIAEGLTKKEVSETLKKIGDKYKVDPNFLSEVSEAIKAEADVTADRKIKESVKPIEKEQATEKASTESERIDRIFKENFAKTLAAMPDFKDVADPDVIKSLTLDPANRDKTFAQIIEKAYGHLVKGKGKTLDESRGGGKEPAGIDYDKASRDTEYFKSIMADPAQRKEYNANIHKRLKL